MVGVFFLVCGWYLIHTERQVMLGQIKAHGQSLAQAASVFSGEPLLAMDYPVLETYANNLAKEENNVGFVRFEDTDGLVVAEAPGASIQKKIEQMGVRLYSADINIQLNGLNRIGKVVIAMLIHPFEQIIAQRIRNLFLFAIVVFILLSLLIMLMIHHMITNPIRYLDKKAQSLGRGNLNDLIRLTQADELGRLADTLDVMRQELKGSYVEIDSQRNKLTTIILSAQDGIVVTDQHDQIVLTNPSSEKLLGKTSQELTRLGFLNLVNNPTMIKTMIDSGHKYPPNVVEFNDYVLQIHASTITHDDGQVIGSAAFVRDITVEKSLEKELWELAITDKLTGLFNRRRLDEVLKLEYDRSVRYNIHLGIMLFDIDHFKNFNDSYGHKQGDRVLQALGRFLLGHFRQCDYPCRYGGEEFCIILPNTDIAGVKFLAERICQEVAMLVVDDLKVTISIGVVATPDIVNEGAADMLKLADNALYAAKKAGRNQVQVAKQVVSVDDTD